MYPENTIPSFESALETGADWIELDVRKTKDGRLVVIHDERTGRIGNIDLKISEVSYEELKKVDAAFNFRQTKNISPEKCPVTAVPLLSEAIALIKTQTKTRLSIQPKESLAGEIIRLAEEMDALEWIGFNDGALELMAEVKSINRKLPVFWDISPSGQTIEETISAAQKYCFESIVMHESLVNKKNTGKIRASGISAGAWTINCPTQMERFFTLGINRFYTDCPAVCLRIKHSLIYG